ncbi:zinc iron permease [Lanmaoa asiatica]|nr:zinc iron permease [Lanmaoa asiatica]
MEPGTEAFYMRMVVTFFIFLVSLLGEAQLIVVTLEPVADLRMSAVSFPALSRRISFLRIPRIIFFVGKHFGTGVILSTAFVHLLQDSFETLLSPDVQARWNIGRYVGLIIMLSVGHISRRMQVFCLHRSSAPNHRGHVDVSTSYVDQLQSYSSPSTSIAPTPPDEFPSDLERAQASPKFTNSNTERTPLIGPTDSDHIANDVQHSPDASYGTVHHRGHMHDLVDGDALAFFEGHHRHEPRDLHRSHHERSRPATMYGPVDEQGRPSGPYHHHHWSENTEDVADTAEHPHCHIDGHENEVKVGKKRQIVGILVRFNLDSLTCSPLTPVKVLQFGIMIHSLVIGLTLSITSGPDFATLLIAVIFHQLFEGLSLGIRIASLPSSREEEFKYLSMLKPVLACLFAITTPAGIVLGMLVFEHQDDMTHVQLTQGIMSAISAGMLTYAACVEMLAGDFVMDPILWRSGIGKQALALFSLAAGVTAMALVGL